VIIYLLKNVNEMLQNLVLFVDTAQHYTT